MLRRGGCPPALFWIVWIVLSSAAAACGTNESASGTDVQATPRPVRLEVVEQGREQDGGFVDIALVNETQGVVLYGRVYDLLQLEGDAFVPIDPPVGPFRSDELRVEPGATSPSWRVGPSVVLLGTPTALEPGTYRLDLIETSAGVLSIMFEL